MDLSVIDNLVEEYMLQEELTDKACFVRACCRRSGLNQTPLAFGALQSSSVASNSSLPVRRACERVRTLVEQGDICAALEVVPEACQEALKVNTLFSGNAESVCYLHNPGARLHSYHTAPMLAFTAGSKTDLSAEETGGS